MIRNTTQNLLSFDIKLENDVVLARQKTRAIAAALKFDAQDQTRIATAVSEIVRNAFQYGGGGNVEFRVDDQENALMIVLRDSGRGISNLDDILDGKYTSQTGMGLGIIGAKRLMDYFHVDTKPGRGTTVTLGKKIPRRGARMEPGELARIIAEVDRASQGPYQEMKHQNQELMNALQELRAKHEQVAQLNRELDETNRGVVALYAELNEKADILQRASELKSRFLSNMTHELRTPLNSIIGLSQILLDRLDGDLSLEQEKQVRFIHSSAHGLMELVNDLLDLAKVEAGKVSVRPATFEVGRLFAALRGMLRPLLSHNSSVNLVFEDPVGVPELYSDEAKVSQILRNFISNALKFTERGEVRVSASLGEGGTVSFSVADTGIGIAPEDRERIFLEWTQVEASLQKRVKGSGLGLPLSRKFAQLLGGDVIVRSEPGIGSTFIATIPIRYVDEMEMGASVARRRSIEAGKLPILVVEDNRETLFIYEKYLYGTAFQIVPARTLKEARQALRDVRPRAIVLDVLLEGEQSWELLLELKHDPSTAKIPVMVATVVDNREKAIALGADCFYTKPLERGVLVQQLDRLTEGSQGKQLLLIDDDEISRYIVKTILSSSAFRVSEASGGKEGLRRASEEEPDLVILDLSMPDLSGYEVLNKLKKDPRTAAIPVIIHTSKVLDAHDREMLSDAVAIVSKESESRELLRENFADAFQKAGFPMSHDEARDGANGALDEERGAA